MRGGEKLGDRPRDCSSNLHNIRPPSRNNAIFQNGHFGDRPQISRLDFGLVSFYPRLSGGLTSRDADPEADGLFVRGAVKARRALVNGLKQRLVAENAQATSRARIYSVFDRETSRYGTVTPGHALSISGNDIIIDPARDDEGVWLEKRLHVNSRRHSYTKVARGRILKSDSALAEVVFDEAISKGTYLLTLYTRSGRGTDFKVTHCRSEVSVK